MQEQAHKGKIKLQAMVGLLRAAFQTPRPFVAGMVTLFSASTVGAILGVFSGVLADRVVALDGENLANDPTVHMCFVIFALGIVLSYVGNRFGRFWINQTLISALTRMHDEAVKALLRAPMSFFYTQSSGKLVSRFSNDFSNAANILDRNFATFCFGIFSIIIASLAVVRTHATLLLIAFPFCLILYFASRYFGVRARDTARIASLANAASTGQLTETIALSDVIAAAKMTSFFESRQRDTVEAAAALQLKTVELQNYRMFTQGILIVALLAVATFYSLSASQTGTLTLGEAAANITLLLMIMRNFVICVELLNLLEVGFTGVERIVELSEIQPEISNTDFERLPQVIHNPAIEFRNVTLRYASHLPPAVKNFSARIAPGEKIGLVGRTGCGKSTLIQGMFRMVPLEPQSIFFDGIDISTLDLYSLRNLFGVVPQDAPLFSGSLTENLFPNQPTNNLVEDEARQALEQVGLWKWVQSLPDGLKTRIQDKGINLSNGQRQLLCLARALAKTPSVVVFDEATSQVDAASEQEVMRALYSAIEGITTIIIAHRLHTVERCDRIFVMSDGVLVEEGKPQDLLADPNSYFSSLKRAQLKNELTHSLEVGT